MAQKIPLYKLILFTLLFIVTAMQSRAQTNLCEVEIIKSATPADDTTFNFSAEFELPQDPNFDFLLRDPSLPTEVFLYNEGNTVTVTEQLPFFWELEDVVCDVTTAGIVPTIVDGGVSLTCNSSGGAATCTFSNIEIRSVPILSEWGLIALAGVLGIVGLMVIKRKRVIS